MSKGPTTPPTKESEDSAMSFLGKLVKPPLTELGQILADRVRLFRYKNQVKILEKAKAYAEKKGIDVKEIPVKILVPYLENSSLEDDDYLQDKWAILLANMADSTSNLQNQVFPYILGQISKSEFQGIHLLARQEKELIYDEEEYYRLQEKDSRTSVEDQENYLKLAQKLAFYNQNGFELDLETFESENLVRLGLMRRLPPPMRINLRNSKRVRVVQSEDTPNYRISELGNFFIQACSEKEKDNT